MNDDDQFDAFLKGEGALARRLQSLEQPAPPAALDAAILARARAAIAQQRAPAANDSAAPARRHGAALGWYWRVPAGIAATILVGVIARQSFEADKGMQDYDASAVEAKMAPPAALPAPAADAAPRAGNEAPRAPAPAPVEVEGPPPQAVASGKPRMPSGAAVQPAPRARALPAPPAAPALVQIEEQIASGADREITVETPRPANGAYSLARTPFSAAPAPAPAAPAPHQPAAAQASATAEAQLSQKAVSAPKSGRVTVTGSAIKREEAALDALLPADTPAAMLERIEQLLAAGNQQAAVAAWKEMQRLHPVYPIPDAIREKLDTPVP